MKKEVEHGLSARVIVMDSIAMVTPENAGTFVVVPAGSGTRLDALNAEVAPGGIFFDASGATFARH